MVQGPVGRGRGGGIAGFCEGKQRKGYMKCLHRGSAWQKGKKERRRWECEEVVQRNLKNDLGRNGIQKILNDPVGNDGLGGGEDLSTNNEGRGNDSY